MTKILKFFLFIIFYFLLSGPAQAAELYFEPRPATYMVGDDFSLSLILDTEGQSVNAVDINILVPKLLRVKDISKDGSILQLWLNEPSFLSAASGMTIHLAGGIPGGAITSKGTVAKINFEAAAIGEGNIAFLPESAILLNDGQGTKLDLKTTGGPLFEVIPKPKTAEAVSSRPEKPDETQKERTDRKKPARFEILFGQDPRVFNGEKFISFFTTDEASGVSHYEVKLEKEPFKIARSPYLIKDISARSVIKVRAYDTEGNYRESVYPGLLKRFWWWITNFVDRLRL
ncbi:MAG: hypothetical protein A2941_01130 [Candidatus Yanofskybacteria bacterium RIFCSPLOWO2_01_FULL_49_17]|uniref:Cohesin domain-containing protein n=1 Tax=Candidatus Yanofskybacteria bacterium RIFCSPLOWO2_01_FULL_49_17 TaxID=1802700 RepID=A0A1F8GQD5_9BACT|nr:MAG: hypothetical protein A2941_01130 [Candidatus Yanofskybacteria bacterium RIFCSPLOWO2_01_FULL_49_17]